MVGVTAFRLQRILRGEGSPAWEGLRQEKFNLI
jgi:hypothetical protein